MTRRALVLGANGMLAHEVAPALREAGWQVLELNHARCDITDERSVDAALERLEPHLVLTCAAYTAVDRTETEPDLAFAVNARGPGILARACSREAIPLLHVSTDFVFDGQADRPYREEDAPHPLGVYARSKRAGEEEVQAASGEAWIVRTGGLYGHHGPSFFRSILSRAARGGPLRVVQDQWTSPTWARDLARQLLAIVEDAPPGVYHATAHGRTTWFEAARRALEIAGLDDTRIEPISTSEHGAPAPRPLRPLLENAALQRLGLDRMRRVFPAALHNAARIASPAIVHGEANLRPEAHRQWRGGPGGPWVGLPAGPDQPGATLARLAL